MNATNTIKAVGTHTYIQQVQRSRGITANQKMVLIHLLEKYQAKDPQGNPHTFSAAGIQNATCLSNSTVKRVTVELRKHKVLKECGCMRFNATQYKPTTLYYFNFEAFNTYLEVKPKVEMQLLPNDSNGETIIDDSNNRAVKPIVKPIVKPTVGLYKKILEEDSTKRKEIGTSTGSVATGVAPTQNNGSGVPCSGNTSMNGILDGNAIADDLDAWFKENCIQSPIQKHIESISNVSPVELRRAKHQGAALQSAQQGIGNNKQFGLATPVIDDDEEELSPEKLEDILNM